LITSDYINGLHDAANSTATVLSTRVLLPGKAVIWAAFFNFVAAFGFGTAVGSTIPKGMIDIRVITFAVILASCPARSSGICSPGTWGCRPVHHMR
jgi:PiT family inorganic phosphate transporter